MIIKYRVDYENEYNTFFAVFIYAVEGSIPAFCGNLTMDNKTFAEYVLLSSEKSTVIIDKEHVKIST
jgi:hypothetical protein